MKFLYLVLIFAVSVLFFYKFLYYLPCSDTNYSNWGCIFEVAIFIAAWVIIFIVYGIVRIIKK